MRPPRKPPGLQEAFDRLSECGVMNFNVQMEEYRHGKAFDKYLHWDELLHRTPPPGLDHLAWWGGLKWQRTANRRIVPLLDTNAGQFSYAEVPPIPERLHQIDLSAGGRLEMPDQVATTDERDRYYVNSLLEESITSSQLEGATTTRQVATHMLREHRRPRDKIARLLEIN